MRLEDLGGKRLALLLIDHEEERDEDEWAILVGKAMWDGKELRVDRGSDRKPFPVPEDTLERLKPVREEARDLFLDADFWLPLFIGPLPDDADPNEYESTDLNWHEIG